MTEQQWFESNDFVMLVRGLVSEFDPSARKMYLLGCANGGSYDVTCNYCDYRGRVKHFLLEHLQSPGSHYRGCWVRDLILGQS